MTRVSYEARVVDWLRARPLQWFSAREITAGIARENRASKDRTAAMAILGQLANCQQIRCCRVGETYLYACYAVKDRRAALGHLAAVALWLAREGSSGVRTCRMCGAELHVHEEHEFHRAGCPVYELRRLMELEE